MTKELKAAEEIAVMRGWEERRDAIVELVKEKQRQALEAFRKEVYEKAEIRFSVYCYLRGLL